MRISELPTGVEACNLAVDVGPEFEPENRPYSTNAMLRYAELQERCYVDPWGGIGHKFAKGATDEDRCVCGELTRAAYLRWNTRRWEGGVRVSAILDYLNTPDCGGIKWVCGAGFAPGRLIRAVRPDTHADSESLAWVSPDVARASLSRALNCWAGVLVLPTGLWGVLSGCDTIARIFADDPKAVFAEIVTHFFADPGPTWWTNRWPGTPIGQRCRIHSSAVIGRDVVIGDDVEIGPNTSVAHTTIGNGVRIGPNCAIGGAGFGYAKRVDGSWFRFPHLARVVIDLDVEIGNNTCIDRGALSDTVIGRGVKIDNLVHIGHNCQIGERALVIANTTLGGGTVVGPDAWVAPSVTTLPQTTIGERATAGLGAVVLRDIADGKTAAGNPARELP